MLIFLISISMFGLSLSSDFPEHEFVKKMTVTKIFVTLLVEQYKFRRLRTLEDSLFVLIVGKWANSQAQLQI